MHHYIEKAKILTKNTILGKSRQALENAFSFLCRFFMETIFNHKHLVNHLQKIQKNKNVFSKKHDHLINS